MDKVSAALNVFFEEPFWVGVFEKVQGDRLSVCKVTFGAEPKDYEIYGFLLKNYERLRFSPAVENVQSKARANPKRMLRQVRKQMNQVGIGTKSHQALKLQQEQQKVEKKTLNRIKKEEEKQRQFQQKQQKKKEKRRGR